jgi:hypothetical protein
MHFVKQKPLNTGIKPSGHHKWKFARQIKTGYCFKKKPAWGGGGGGGHLDLLSWNSLVAECVCLPVSSHFCLGHFLIPFLRLGLLFHNNSAGWHDEIGAGRQRKRGKSQLKSRMPDVYFHLTDSSYPISDKCTRGDERKTPLPQWMANLTRRSQIPKSNATSPSFPHFTDPRSNPRPSLCDGLRQQQQST